MVDPAALPLFQATPALFTSVKERYAEPHRHYHVWAHIEQMVELFKTIETKLTHNEATLYAVYYHDAVYAVPSATNEEDSATLFSAEASAHINTDIVETTKRFIVATKTHSIAEEMPGNEISDCQYFLDIDMSIVGAEPDIYRLYANNIRREYAVIPDALYYSGRKQILTSFLEKDRIFLTDHFHNQFEAQARENVTAEIARLVS